MPSLLSKLTANEQARLLEELNYTNLAEIRHFCDERGIPYRIVAEYPNGKAKTTKDTDRKPIVLARRPPLPDDWGSWRADAHPGNHRPHGEAAGAAGTSRPSLLSLVREGVRTCHAVAPRLDWRPVP